MQIHTRSPARHHRLMTHDKATQHHVHETIVDTHLAQSTTAKSSKNNSKTLQISPNIDEVEKT